MTNRLRYRPFLQIVRWVTSAAVVALWAPVASAQPATSSIYTCIDAHGRRLTSDRPILACNDREQRELNRSGTTKRVVGPTLTAKEREAEEARQREAELDRQRARDAIRRDEALITRYPNQAAHEHGRKNALAQSQTIVGAAKERIAELQQERKGLNEEMEFYKKDPSRAPAKVRRAIEANAEAIATQQRAIDAQQAERDRINARFDEQLARLKVLWAAQAKAPGKAPGGASAPAARTP
ncbi:DUF4124 domain-containing protein [Ottowia sp. GY511]|uniref:DUF4124 domain-containing protein n=1 Tax=Ottowia flava TaxID=2675430 RepID=A0ABW4KZ60_9BURK|nr:DUF4124 domain-containing protein [Ottowia sp. GY511]TXK27322.1 DUF4124 domain-containing protein [Ottowia sp. GY511]